MRPHSSPILSGVLFQLTVLVPVRNQAVAHQELQSQRCIVLPVGSLPECGSNYFCGEEEGRKYSSLYLLQKQGYPPVHLFVYCTPALPMYQYMHNFLFEVTLHCYTYCSNVQQSFLR